MPIIISAILIFILLCATAALAFIVPLDPQWPQQWPKQRDARANCETDSVLATLAQHSNDVHSVVGIVR